MKNIASFEDIINLRTTDIYFMRAKEILNKVGKNPHVTMDITLSNRDLPWIVLAGIDDFSEILKGKMVNVYSLPEGTVFPPRDINGIPIPVLTIEGKYLEFGLYETPLLGTVSQASGIATKAARFKKRIGNLTLSSFGVRRMHPSLAPLIDRNAYLGGCDKVSSIIGAERVGVKPEGTMPHSLLLIMGEEPGWKLYDEVLDKESPRIALVDTFCDERDGALRAANLINNLFGVRLDTPSSRRGNFPDLVREVRWELDQHGFKHIAIIVSGGIKEEDIEGLKEAGASGFGIGTSISSAPSIDFAMDIVEIDGVPISKRGKFSGRKNVFRCPSCHSFKVSRNNKEKCPKDGSDMESLSLKIIEEGKVIYKENLKETRDYVLRQLEWVEI